MADGSLIFDTRIDTDGFENGTKNVTRRAKATSETIEKEYQKLGQKVTGIFKKIGSAIAAAFAVKQIISFTKEAISLASDLQEVQNVVDTAFGSMAYKMEDFASTCVKTYGMSKLTAKEMGSTFMAMAKGMGQETELASDKAIELTGRLGDVASFYNKTASEVNTIGKAIYSGETEPLKAIGIVMTETNLEAYALAKGYKKLYSKMSASEKLLVRQNYFLEQTELAAGDFVKTQDSWANQTRILSEQWKEFMTLIGNVAMEVLTPTIKLLNTMVGTLVEVGEQLSDIFGITAFSVISDEAAAAQSELEALGNTTEEVRESSTGGTASFDKLDVVSTGNSDSGTDVMEEKVDALEKEAEATEETEKATSKLESTIYQIGEALQWVGMEFETSFIGSFGNISRLKKIQESFSKIGISIRETFTSSKLQGAAGSFFKSLIERAGATVGAYTSIGASIINNLLGGISTNLEENKERITDSLASLFNIGERWNGIKSDYLAAVAEIATVFEGDEAKGITSSILSIFTLAGLDILEVLGKLGTDVLELLTAPFVENKELIRSTIKNTFAELQPVLESFQSMIDNAFNAVRTTYDEKIAPFLTTLKEGIVEIGAKWLEAYNTYILPVISYASAKFKELVDGSLKELQEKCAALIGKVATALGALWNGLLKPFITWYIDKAAPIIASGLKNVVAWVSTAVKWISAELVAVIDVLGAILDFFVTGFTKGWKEAWEDLKTSMVNIFTELGNKMKNIINGILGSVESMANGVIKGINKMIDALNGLSFDIPDWVPSIGGQTFGLDISKVKEVSIPRLATGTVVPANFGEFAAILGDNKRETEVVSPLSTIKKAVKEAQKESGDGGEIIIVLQLDGEEIFREVVRRNRIYKKSNGGKSALA